MANETKRAPRPPLQPINGAVGTAASAQRQGYTGIDGGWDGVPVSGINPQGQRVAFINGRSPEDHALWQSQQQGQGAATTGTSQAGTTQAGNNAAASQTPSTATGQTNAAPARPSIAQRFAALPNDVAMTVNQAGSNAPAAPASGQRPRIADSFRSAPAAAPYASGGNFNTQQATNDFAAGKITAAQRDQVYSAASRATDTQGAGISPSTQAEMRGTAGVGQQLQASQDAQQAADAAYQRQHPGPPSAAQGGYGALPAIPGQTQVAPTDGGSLMMFGANGPQTIAPGASVTSLPGNKTIIGGRGFATQVQSGAGAANPTQEAGRSTNADGSVTIRTASGGTVTAPAGTPVAGGSTTGADTGMVGAGGQQVVRNGQGTLTPGTPQVATPASSAPAKLDNESQKAIVAQYPEIANTGSYANTAFLAGLKPGQNTLADAQSVLQKILAPPSTPAAPAPTIAQTPTLPATNFAPITTRPNNDLETFPAGTAAAQTPAAPPVALNSGAPVAPPMDTGFKTTIPASTVPGADVAATTYKNAQYGDLAPTAGGPSLTGDDAIQQAAIERNANLGRPKPAAPAAPTLPGTGNSLAGSGGPSAPTSPAWDKAVADMNSFNAGSSATPAAPAPTSTAAQTLANAPGYGADPASQSAQPAPLGKSALYKPGQIAASLGASTPGSGTTGVDTPPTTTATTPAGSTTFDTTNPLASPIKLDLNGTSPQRPRIADSFPPTDGATAGDSSAASAPAGSTAAPPAGSTDAARALASAPTAAQALAAAPGYGASPGTDSAVPASPGRPALAPTPGGSPDGSQAPAPNGQQGPSPDDDELRRRQASLSAQRPNIAAMFG